MWAALHSSPQRWRTSPTGATRSRRPPPRIGEAVDQTPATARVDRRHGGAEHPPITAEHTVSRGGHGPASRSPAPRRTAALLVPRRRRRRLDRLHVPALHPRPAWPTATTRSASARSTSPATSTPTPASRTWTIDPLRAPTPQITAQPEALTSSRSASVSFPLPPDARRRPSSAAWTPGPGPPAPPPRRSPTCRTATTRSEVRAKLSAVRDRLDAVAKATWKVDTTPARTKTLHLPRAHDSGTDTGTRDVRLHLGDRPPRFQCRLDGETTWTACTSPLRLSGLAHGSHQVEIRQGDGAGNWSPATVPPSGSSTPAARPPRRSSPASRRHRPPRHLRLRLRRRARRDPAVPPRRRRLATTRGPSLDLTGLAVRGHVLEVRQIDAAGNTGVTAERRWTIAPAPAPAPAAAAAPAATPAPAARTPRAVVGTVGTLGGRPGPGRARRRPSRPPSSRAATCPSAARSEKAAARSAPAPSTSTSTAGSSATAP